ICQSWIPPNGADGRPDFESSNFCRQIPDGSTIQSGYFPVLNKMYLFDDQQSVCIMENSLISLDLVRRPLTEFLGCDVELLMSFQLQSKFLSVLEAHHTARHLYTLCRDNHLPDHRHCYHRSDCPLCGRLLCI